MVEVGRFTVEYESTLLIGCGRVESTSTEQIGWRWWLVTEDEGFMGEGHRSRKSERQLGVVRCARLTAASRLSGHSRFLAGPDVTWSACPVSARTWVTSQRRRVREQFRWPEYDDMGTCARKVNGEGGKQFSDHHTAASQTRHSLWIGNLRST